MDKLLSGLKEEFKISTEVMQPQERNKYKILEDRLRAMLDVTSSDYQSHVEGLEEDIESLFNLKVYCVTESSDYPYIETYNLNPVSNIADSGIKNYIIHMTNKGGLSKDEKDHFSKLDKFPFKSGYIDQKNMRIGGDFLDLKRLKLSFSPVFLDEMDFTVPQMTAILLHEIGHILMELSSLVTFREGSSILRESLSKKTNGSMEKLVFNMERNTNVFSGNIDGNLSTMKDNKMLPFKLIEIIAKTYLNDIPGAIDGDLDKERMADNIAVKCGYGTELFYALDKLTTMRGNEVSTTGELIKKRLKIYVTTIVTVAAIAFAYLTLNVILACSLYGFALLVIWGRSEDRHLANRDLNFRLETIYLNVINKLKNSKDKKEHKVLMGDLIKMRKTLNKHFKNRNFIPTDTMNKQDKNIRNLELLANNELFVQSVRLSLL